MVSYIIHLLFLTFTSLLFLRVLMSWIPRLHHYRFFHFLSFYTDPYLSLFRKVIPRVGGIDMSAIAGFIVLYIVEQILLRIFS